AAAGADGWARPADRPGTVRPRRQRVPLRGAVSRAGRMKVALTGATGYTGGRLLAVLLGRGDAVRALARPSSKRPALSAEPAWIEGDLADVGALNRLVEGVDAVVHVAAV